MKFLRNTWYLAAYSREIERRLLARKIVGDRILMYRRQDGGVAAMSNLCPHRFAPLDRGQLIGDGVQCRYHGLEFGPDGRCTRNPHMDRITPRMNIRAYPVAERDGMVWLWLGDQEPTPHTVPDMSAYSDREGVYTSRSYLAAPYRYDILIDNLLDLSHADYLHRGSFSGGEAERSETEVSLDGDNVTVARRQWGAPAPPVVMNRVDAEKLDICIRIEWSPSQAMRFRAGVAPSGTPIASLTDSQFYHVATPADEGLTHYFMGITRFGQPDADADAMVARRQVTVIDSEDGPMLAAIDEIMAGRELLDLQPLILPTDAGGMQARAVMKRLLAAEENACGHEAA